MKNIEEYKKLFQQKGIEITDKEVEKIIENMNAIGNLLFDKYKKEVLEK